MNMMKEIKMRRFSSKVFLVVLILVVVAGIFIVVQRGKIKEDSKSILEKQRFIVVDRAEYENSYRFNFENGYDLKSNNFYSITQVVEKMGRCMMVVQMKSLMTDIIYSYTKMSLPQF